MCHQKCTESRGYYYYYYFVSSSSLYVYRSSPSRLPSFVSLSLGEESKLTDLEKIPSPKQIRNGCSRYRGRSSEDTTCRRQSVLLGGCFGQHPCRTSSGRSTEASEPFGSGPAEKPGRACCDTTAAPSCQRLRAQGRAPEKGARARRPSFGWLGTAKAASRKATRNGGRTYVLALQGARPALACTRTAAPAHRARRLEGWPHRRRGGRLCLLFSGTRAILHLHAVDSCPPPPFSQRSCAGAPRQKAASIA